MSSMLDTVRRVACRLAGRARRRLSGRDGGFVLLESLIAISLITVIMAAIGAEYVASIASVSRQRATQSASQVANSTLEQVRALRPSDLVAGRGSTSVATQFSRGNSIPTVTPWLQQMDPASDPSAPATAGANAAIPTCDPTPQGAAGPALCTQKPGTVAFTVSQFIGTCWLITSGTSSTCVPAAQKTSTSVSYLRVVVSISWRGSTCGAGCFYVTSTLISADADPTFKANQPPTAAPVVSPPGNRNNDIGDTVNLQLSVVTGTGVPGFSWTATGLPSGLSSSSSGVISGVVAGPTGIRSVTVQVTDGYGRSASASFSWTVGNRPAVTAPANQVTAINVPVNVQVPVTCPNAPCTVTLTNPPPGLSIDPTGVITGTPTVPGTTTTSVTVTDAAGVTVTSSTFTWTVLPLAPSCPTAVTLANGSFETPGVSAGAGTNVGNGTSGLAWKTNNPNGQVEFWANGGNSQAQNGNTAIVAQSGNQWVEVNGSGMDTLYQDLPTTPGQVLQWSLWHRARNATNNVNAQDSIQVQVGTTTQQSPQVPNGAVSPTISDGAAVWVQYTGTYVVPAGQTTTRFQVAATSTSSGSAGVGNFLDNVNVTGAPCLASTPANQISTVNTAITPVQMTASQGSGTYTWSAGSTLPAGLTLSSSGLITGTPTATGTTSVSLIVTDSLSSYQQVVPFTWTVKAAPTVSTPSNQTSTVGVAVNVGVGSTCPNTPCTYTLNGGPAGLSINSSGTITGTPTTAGTTNPTVTIRDAAGATATTSAFTWTVKAGPTITTPSNQTSTVGRGVTLGIGSTCPNTPCTYTLAGAPAGLTINSATGVISGTPTTAGTSSSVTVTITDAAGATATTGAFTWTVKAAPTVTTPSTQTSTVGVAVSVSIGSTCPNTPCTYTLAGAPAGLTINSATGVISGTPTTIGTSSSVTVTITDAAGATATTNPFTWIVRGPAPTITSPGNSSIDVGVQISYQLSSTCSNTPCSYSLSGAPPGLTINSATGVISGAATTPGVYNAVVATITDSTGATASTAPATVTVYARPTVTSPGNQTSTVNTALILPITSTCPNPSCTYALTGAPAGLTIDNTGRITGTPTATGTSSSVKVTVTDAAGVAIDSGTFSWTVTAAPSATSPGALNTVNNNTVDQPFTTSCPNAPCTYTLNNGPAGLSITTPGHITGRVTSAPQTFPNVTIRVTDRSGATATSASFAWYVYATPAGRWTFDEASGSSATDTAGSHNATLTGGYGRTTAAAQGANALTLNGSSGTAATTSGSVLNTANSFTVSAWVKLASTSGYQTFVSQDGTNVSAFYLQLRGDTGKFAFTRLGSDTTNSPTTTMAGATAAPVAGQWYQLTGVYDAAAGTISLFVNGVRQSAPVAYSGGWNGTGNFAMGRGNYGGATDWTNGAIDDVRAYQLALSDDAATQLAQAGYWRLNEASGTTAGDSSLNGNAGTLNGGTTWTTGTSGSAAQFNGTSGAITNSATVLDTGQSFSVSAWVKADATNTTATAVSLDSSNVSAFALQLDGGKWSFSRRASDSSSATISYAKPSSATASANSWYLLTGVYDSVAQTITLYVNGTLAGSTSFTTGWKGTGKFVIGRGQSGAAAANFFPGAVDEVRAYQFALDQAGVTALTTQTPPVPTAPTATAGATSASVSWTAPANIAGSPITGYVVTPYLNGVAQTPVTYNSTATSQTLTGLATGGSYTFTVAAVNAAGTSAASAVSNTVLAS